MTSELTLLVLRLAFLAVLWIFVFSIIYALRSDLFGTRASEYQRRVEAQSRQQTFAGAENRPLPAAAGGAPAAAPAPAGAPRPQGNATAAPPRKARIHLTSGPKRGTEVLLGDEPLTIGRAPDSGLVIQDDYTSTRHARIERQGTAWRIVDLDSTNGTYLAGSRVTGSAELPAGTPVRIGTTTFELR
ncbi:phosphopeptide-binding protein [Pseudoclavibacter endophyticus]|uniref:FHA domain-containing protein n=1 Tax=Pseudoclavibacter endophyticus TaxID=1778590 RepID=A0A6H9WQY4_9MICO|nr:FHA domain-containing protein [Pseudoclavibacter endophyticus]KAB1648740.1 FHA domain-containing protein [Pseudoclavibacter endophyticus]GGA68916.1 phosphopeptide-binding protein [Pseudoclavibacter endophyticus]